MRTRQDPLAEVESLVRDVYAYVAYRVPDGAEAEEITSAVFERAVRYRKAYDASKGTPIAWMIGIARTQIAEQQARRTHLTLEPTEVADAGDLETTSLDRLSVRDAVRALDGRSRELVALRYGVGLSTREIAAEMNLEENAVNVALHRARERLRVIMTSGATIETLDRMRGTAV